MKDAFIGNLMKLSLKNWEKFKEKRPLVKDDLDYALVKFLDDDLVLIDKGRLNKILNHLQ